MNAGGFKSHHKFFLLTFFEHILIEGVHILMYSIYLVEY